MILFYKNINTCFAVDISKKLNEQDLQKLNWLFEGVKFTEKDIIKGYFIGPKKEMVTPWSTNAVEITQNMSIAGIKRIEKFYAVKSKNAKYDKMLQQLYKNLTQDIFEIHKKQEPVIYIDDLYTYNKQQGLALNEEEIKYLQSISKKNNRKLTDSEVFGFSQVNSEHCRHKIFNGTFVIDNKEEENSLFEMIKKTSKVNHNKIVSAYKDNCALLKGPSIKQFAPKSQDKPDFFETKNITSVISLKAETHNFPTTVEPFNGAATGSGGEIRDRMAGGKASIPMAGTAVYMTSYPRLERNRSWEKKIRLRKWLYNSPKQILIKASNGASDFGNKFGQPLICGSVLTFEHIENKKKIGYDKVIMMAGGIGFAQQRDCLKDIPEKGDKIVMLGGDNYRIGMGGGAVSSVSTGEFSNVIELNAVQRSNPEMQKRVFNVIRAMSENTKNPVVAIHDHGAGGHLNCFAELVEKTGGTININKLPVGDNTLSDKEIIGNESQERMGLIIKEKDIKLLKNIAERERTPMYVVGEVTDDKIFKFIDDKANINPIDLNIEDMLGNPPKTVITDENITGRFEKPTYNLDDFEEYLKKILQLESVACKDWLTNKVDRSVTGKIARQQTTGTVQLPLSDLGAVALDYKGEKGIATSIGHAPVSGLIDPASGSILSIAEALTNIIWAPIKDGIKGISLSANWMWPAKNKGEDARLYKAVEAASNFACKLGVNIPTGKDSLSMTQKYENDDIVYAPGTVIISACGQVENVKKIVSPVLINDDKTTIFYIDLSNDNYKLGGSCFSQIMNKIGDETPNVKDPEYFARTFDVIQNLIMEDKILAGHDISAGGLMVTLLEMCFADNNIGLDINLSGIKESDITKLLFSENPGIVFQTNDAKYIVKMLSNKRIKYNVIGRPIEKRTLKIIKYTSYEYFDIDALRDVWYKTSYLLDKKQSGNKLALKRFNNYKKQILEYKFNKNFTGKASQYNIDLNGTDNRSIKAAIIREKGVNGDREMAYSLYLAGFDVKDVHMTDLISGRETLKDINFIVFVGGFSNSDVLGSAKGWAGAFLYNEKAKKTLDNFYKRDDTLSLGVCNGCQLMVELGLIYPNDKKKIKMLQNNSNKFESAFINVVIQKNNSVMLKSLAGSRLGAWIAHGQGKFKLPYNRKRYCIPVKYAYNKYPGNPNGSAYSVAAVCSEDGRHLAMMPHLERSIFPWQWANYPEKRNDDQITPWIQAFVNAKEWIKEFQV
jgi:phosphoribosylformylglycinamidine synthase